MEKIEKELLLNKLKTNQDVGLSSKEAAFRLEKNGKNEFQKKKKQNLLIKFLLEFKDALVIVLLIAAIVSLVIEPDEWIESAIIFVVVIINAILGVYQENKAEKSLEALEKMSSPLCKVIRDGITLQVNTSELVVGDIIIVEAGDFIPADARILECSNLQVDESALTGESVSVIKNSEVIIGEEIPLGDMKNMLFSSTFVTNGRGVAVVTATGMQTEIGKIAGMLISDEIQTTPLQHKLTQVSKVIGIISIFICFLVFILEFITSKDILESFKIAISLAVAAIPEGLATVVTIVLSIGVSNMAKVNAIVKKLPAVETLGSTSIVCSDKTGTLTQNKMTVLEIYTNNIKKVTNELTAQEKELLSYFALCSDAKINYEDDKEIRIGDPTETALIEVNNKYGNRIDGIERIDEIPFDSSRKMMTVFVKINDKIIQITKGAPDIIINNSKNNKKELDAALIANDNLAKRALRVLAVGYKELHSLPQNISDNEILGIEKDLTFLGLVGMIDPARPEVKDAIKTAKEAGIRTIMITGDHVTTAKAIALELGILEGNQKAISSKDLAQLSDEELYEHIEEYSVYARVSPEDKVRIVETWQKKDKIVAMTGDGVNDSPSLKRADIGCAMGITGTDVSKEASDMILLDDNFATIITAVKEGRGIYANIKKCIKYLLSSNIGEVIAIFVSSIIALFIPNGLGIPLLPIHLLWINLITDSLPAFGIGMEKADSKLMKEKPRDKNESFFANNMFLHIILEGLIIGLLALAAFLIGNQQSLAIGQTMAFLTLSTTQLFHAFNVKSDSSIFNKSIFNNKFLNFSFIIGFLLQVLVIYTPFINTVIFNLEPLSFSNLLISIGLAFCIIIIMEISKLLGYKQNKKIK